MLDIFSKKESKKENIKIIVDNREGNSLVPSLLIEKDFEIDWQQLEVGDYLVNGVAIERKTVADFKSSIINKRIFSQLVELKQYPKHLLLIEGILDENVYSGGIHENAFRGFLLSVLLEYNVPIVFTHNEADTAKYISVLAKKEKKTENSLRASKISFSDEEQIQFILEGFPNVGATKAKKLIEKFGSLKEVVNSSVEELEEILGKRAGEFRKLIEEDFREKIERV